MKMEAETGWMRPRTRECVKPSDAGRGGKHPAREP